MKIAATTPVPAPNNPTDYFQGGQNGAGVFTPTNAAQNNDPVTILHSLINYGMGFLGIVAVIIILWSGFEWMTSAGDEKKVDTAKKRMISGVIGIAIILAAWSVAYFAVSQLSGLIGGQ